MASSPHPDQAPSAGGAAPGPRSPDWERIELDYRAGIKTLRQIADENGITHGAINKRAKRDGWERDLSQKIQAKADALVSRAAVSSQVSADTKVRERAVIDGNAQAVADVRLGHRKDARRVRELTNRLMDELEQQTDPATLAKLQELAAAVVTPGEKPGRDRYGELLEAVISLPERSKTLKVLAESLRIVVDMERTAFGMDKVDPVGTGPGEGGVARIAVEFVRPAAREDDDA
ncbi:hypothetical protein DR66_4253 [Delftia acidovorans]|uniref:hypothetical protein n=1 Tax=Delftia acidovorans TaxID=80866 RepID=UPI00050701E4|nr:hypothetical protein [Delftia acidovorans]KFJ13310.1 hypothetical protein DR66_4253 [Delftia acidovorans]QQB47823.1 hypothetical protein I6H54_15565 [Delftia acidovorans]